MTRKRKTLLAVLALILLAGGGFAWYWRATATDRQVNALLAELRDDEPGLVDRWLIKLGLAKDPRTGRWYPPVAEDLAKLGPSAVPALIRALRDDNRDVRLAAAMALGELRDRRAFEPLIVILKDEDWAMRHGAARALGNLGDPGAVELLIATLKDKDENVRGAAAYALGELGDARAVEPLIAALKDEGGGVRYDAAEALGKLGAPAGRIRAWRRLLGKQQREHFVTRYTRRRVV